MSPLVALHDQDMVQLKHMQLSETLTEIILSVAIVGSWIRQNYPTEPSPDA